MNTVFRLMQSTPKGFTLLELLLSLVVVAILAVIAIPFYLSYQTKNDFQIALVTTAHSLRRAQTLSRAVVGDASWGVHVEAGSITLFQGTDFGSRNLEADESFVIPTTIVLTGLSDVIFSKFNGLPESTGDFIFESPLHDIASVSVNNKGMIDY